MLISAYQQTATGFPRKVKHITVNIQYLVCFVILYIFLSGFFIMRNSPWIPPLEPNKNRLSSRVLNAGDPVAPSKANPWNTTTIGRGSYSCSVMTWVTFLCGKRIILLCSVDLSVSSISYIWNLGSMCSPRHRWVSIR